MLLELKNHLYTKPTQNILALRRQGSGKDGFLVNSPLRRSTELRRSTRNRSAVSRNLFNEIQRSEVIKILFNFFIVLLCFRSDKNDTSELSFPVEETLDDSNPEENSRHFVAILVKSLCLLEKLPFAVNVILLICFLSLKYTKSFFHF